MIEFRNDSSIPLMIRIVHTMCDNVYVDIEDAPEQLTDKDIEGGFVIVEPNDYYPIEKMKEMI